jgi:hypothetical protein
MSKTYRASAAAESGPSSRCQPIAQVGLMAMGVVDTLMVARVGVTELAAVAVASTWVWSSGAIARGIVQGMVLVSQAHGAGTASGGAGSSEDWSSPSGRSRDGALTPRDPLVGSARTPVARLRRPHDARLPSALGFLLFTAQRQYLAGRAITRPAMW